MLTTIPRTQQQPAWPAGAPAIETAALRAQNIVKGYEPISLDEMAGVSLLNRTDTKFVMGSSTLLAALRALDGDYRVLDVAGVRLHHYRTLYFDTAAFTLYLRHHAGAYERYKVRSRAYMESGLSFLEVKRKTNKKRTIKSRLETPGIQLQVNRETAGFLMHYYPYEPAELLPVLWNSFARITLVSKRRAERLTLDFDLSFQAGLEEMALPGIAIAEMKREGLAARSDFVQQMRALGVRPISFSKYCLGVSALYPQLKQNNFKARHLLVQKLMRGESHGQYH